MSAERPEQEPRFGIECGDCGEIVEITDTTTTLFLDEGNQLWAYIKCTSDYDCDAATLEVPPEDMGYYSHLGTYYNQKGEAVSNVIEVNAVDPGVVEIQVDPATLAIITLLTNWDEFVNYVEPWEIAEYGHYRV